MLSEADLPLRFVGTGAYFDFLGPEDEPWLRVLLAEMARFEGRRRREICERLAEPLPCAAPHFKRRAASRVLLRLWRREPVAGVAPVRARAELFGAATVGETPAAALIATIAGRFNVTSAALAEALFADLPGERILRAPDPIPTAGEIALSTNLAIAQSVLKRATSITLFIEGGTRPIVRLAKLRGLLCTISEPSPNAAIAARDVEPGPTLLLSGPFSLFRHTLLYGRALAELVPHLAWCARFELRASCVFGGRPMDVSLKSGDPIFPAGAPAAFDSKLEERFAHDVERLAPDWDVIREPEAVRAGGTLIFPDFLLRHRIHAERRVLIEIVGFWTPQYLTEKCERLRQARLSNLILWVDEDRACADGELPPGVPVVRFRRRVDAVAVMRAVERLVDDTRSGEPRHPWRVV